jgi:hypothetical protein
MARKMGRRGLGVIKDYYRFRPVSQTWFEPAIKRLRKKESPFIACWGLIVEEKRERRSSTPQAPGTEL